MPRLRHVLLCLIAIALFAGGSCQTSSPARPLAVAPAAKLPVDPAVTVLTLDNGVTCWIRRHGTPAGKVTMWLHLHSGSLNENDDQRGLAHFLEHMAFNGTAHFPPGQLVKYFESIGMQFGHHQNAFTSFEQTTYQLTLPNIQPATLEQGLTCLADYAYRMSLLPEELQRESSVVLEEMRAREGVQKRISDQILPLYAPGSRLAERLPIGLKAIVEKADHALVERYYQTWYRPDLATVIVAGDFPDLAALEALLRRQFGGWAKPAAPAVAAAPGVKSYTTERGALVTDPEWKEAYLAIVNFTAGQRTHTVGEYRAELVDDLGAWMLSRRLQDLIQAGTAPFQEAGAAKGYAYQAGYMSSVWASGQPQDARALIEVVAREVQRARTHGFLAQELEQGVKATLSGREQATKTEATRDSRSLVGALNSAATERRLPPSAAQELELANALLPTITLAEVGAAFQRNFPPAARLVLAILPEHHETGLTEAEVLKLVHAQEAAPVAAKAAEKQIASLLETVPAPGQWVKTEEDPELKIVSATLANGVRAHVRSMDYKKNQVHVEITLAGGQLYENIGTRGLSEAAALTFDQPATKRFNSTQVRNFLTGKKVSVSGAADEDRLALSLSGAPEDLELGFQLAHLLLTEPRLEAAALNKWRTRFKLQYLMAQTVAEARLVEELPKLVTADVRVHQLTPEVVDRLTVAAAQQWLERLVATCPIEVAVVGDLPTERALQLVATYLGSLPARQPAPADLAARRQVEVQPGPLEKNLEVKSVANRAAVFCGWQTPGWEDRDAARKLILASLILETRVREEIREKQGWTYSSAVFYRGSFTLRNVSFLGCFFTADPEKAARALAAAREIFAAFAATGPTAAELATAHKQIDNNLEVGMKEPTFWSSKLAVLDYRGFDLDYYKTTRAAYQQLTAADLKAVLAPCVVEARRVQMIAAAPPAAKPVNPAPAEAQAPAPAAPEEKK